jgi:ElaA protein
MKWTLKSFDDLLPNELYAILQLRAEVFVVEQNCVFQDMDNKDQTSFHLMGWQDNQLVASTRLLPKGLGFDEVSIGRVVTSKLVRRTGVGKLLMQESIAQIDKLFGKQPIRIGAQCYLIAFYKSFGFVPEGEIYLEDNIEHIEMIFNR